MPVFGRRLITNRVGYIQDGSARVDNRIEYGAKVIDFGAACIFGGELNLIAKAPSALDRLHGEIESLPAGLVQLVFEVDVAGCQEGVDARPRRTFQRLPAFVDIRGHRTSQTRNRHPANFGGDPFHRLEISFGCDGEPGLDDIHLQPLQLPRHLELLFHIHAEARRLFSIS